MPLGLPSNSQLVQRVQLLPLPLQNSISCSSWKASWWRRHLQRACSPKLRRSSCLPRKISWHLQRELKTRLLRHPSCSSWMSMTSLCLMCQWPRPNCQFQPLQLSWISSISWLWWSSFDPSENWFEFAPKPSCKRSLETDTQIHTISTVSRFSSQVSPENCQ